MVVKAPETIRLHFDIGGHMHDLCYAQHHAQTDSANYGVRWTAAQVVERNLAGTKVDQLLGGARPRRRPDRQLLHVGEGRTGGVPVRWKCTP
jgi:hypothetical protein